MLMRCVWLTKDLHAVSLQGEPRHMHLQCALSLRRGSVLAAMPLMPVKPSESILPQCLHMG